MSLDQIVNALVTIALVTMMLAAGLSVALADLIRVARNGRLTARAALANYLCVPAATLGLLLLIDPHPMVAAGWLLGGPAAEVRKAMALTASLRNFGVGLVIATSAFAETAAITAVVSYGLISLFGALAFAIFVGSSIGGNAQASGLENAPKTKGQYASAADSPKVH